MKILCPLCRQQLEFEFNPRLTVVNFEDSTVEFAGIYIKHECSMYDQFTPSNSKAFNTKENRGRLLL